MRNIELTEEQKTALEEMKKHEWVVSWSGGKDSTATIILMHEYNIPIKEIIYVRMMYDDTLPATLPIMTDFVDNAKSVFEEWGYNVKFAYPRLTMVEEASHIYYKSTYPEKNGHYYGITAISRGHCKMTGYKQEAIAKASDPNDYAMVGYAADETDRIHRLNEKKQSIMVTLNIKEEETFDICREYNLLSPLYDLGLKRDGCWFCPNAAKKEREYLLANEPELCKRIKGLCDMCGFDLSYFKNTGRNHWLEVFWDEKYTKNTEPMPIPEKKRKKK